MASRSPNRWARRSGMHLPWKYGFKSIKSIVQGELRDGAADRHVGTAAGFRIWLLGQCESGRCRIRAGARPPSRCWAPASACHAALQRLWRRSSPRSMRGSRARSSICEYRAAKEKAGPNRVRPRLWACPGEGTLPVRVRVVRKHQRSDTRGGSNFRCLCSRVRHAQNALPLMSDKLTHLMGVMLSAA